MLCLWVLLGNHLSKNAPITADGVTESISFNVPSVSRTMLERRKDEDCLRDIASQLMQSIPGLNAEQQSHLNQFFSFTVCVDLAKRTSDIGKLLDLLNPERWVSSDYHRKASLIN